MSAKTNHVKIGIFVLIALVLFVLGLLAFGAKSYFTPKVKFETAVKGDVSGLSVGSGVQLRGVPIGKVTRINFVWNVYPASTAGLIIVDFEIETDLMPLPPGMDMKTAVANAVQKGLRAVVKGQGITGTSILSLDTLDPTNAPPLAIDFTPRSHYVPSAPGQFSRMLESIEKTLNNVQQLDVAGISTGVSNTLNAVAKLTDKLAQLDLQSVSTNATALLANAKETSTKIQGLVDEVRENLKNMKLASVSTNAEGLLADLRSTNTKLQLVLDNVGNVPMESTVGDLRMMVQTLNDVLVELKRYPAGFIFGQPPPPARSVQTSQK